MDGCQEVRMHGCIAELMNALMGTACVYACCFNLHTHHCSKAALCILHVRTHTCCTALCCARPVSRCAVVNRYAPTCAALNAYVHALYAAVRPKQACTA